MSFYAQGGENESAFNNAVSMVEEKFEKAIIVKWPEVAIVHMLAVSDLAASHGKPAVVSSLRVSFAQPNIIHQGYLKRGLDVANVYNRTKDEAHVLIQLAGLTMRGGYLQRSRNYMKRVRNTCEMYCLSLPAGTTTWPTGEGAHEARISPAGT